VTVDESEEEKAKRLDHEQAKADKENGKLEYYAAITDEGYFVFLSLCFQFHCFLVCVVPSLFLL